MTPALVLAAPRPDDLPAVGVGPASWKGLKESISISCLAGNTDGMPMPMSMSTQPLVPDFSDSGRPLALADADGNGEERPTPVLGEGESTGDLEPPRCCSVPLGVVSGGRP